MLWIIIVLSMLPAFLTIKEASEGLLHSETPYGYTLSTLIFLIPSAVMLYILHGRTSLKPIVYCILTLPIGGIFLDVFAGALFFSFPNTTAILGIYVMGYNATTGLWNSKLPIEEFLFYYGGFSFMVSLYVWMSTIVLAKYTVEHPQHAESLPDWFNYLCSGVVFCACFLKPTYLVFLIVCLILPALGLYLKIRKNINQPALYFSVLTTLFISVIWEVTLAVQHGWWSYVAEYMTGIYIKPWFNLPIEETLMWIGGPIISACAYEYFRV